MHNPLISVVIANYNYGRYLEAALLSIFNQDCADQVEVIVCDAASIDNSVEIINKYSDRIAWWVSEKDRGQSDAFNKGFRHARGAWVTWLNADEMYTPGAIRAVIRKIFSCPQAEWITANDFKFDDSTKKIVNVGWGPHCHPRLLLKNHAPAAVFGPTSFIKRTVYEALGPIDINLHYSMDYDYWCRLTMAGIRQCRLNRICWADRIQPSSKTFGANDEQSNARKQAELELVRIKNGYSFSFSFANLWYCLWMLVRVIDGSLLVRFFKKWTLEGRDMAVLMKQ